MAVIVLDKPAISVGEALMTLQFVASRGEAKRKIAEGAVKVGEQTVSDIAELIFVTEEVKISLGKKKHGLLTRS